MEMRFADNGREAIPGTLLAALPAEVVAAETGRVVEVVEPELELECCPSAHVTAMQVCSECGEGVS